MEGIEEQAV